MGCRSIKIEGIENITVNQGVDVDLMDGVHAYDSNLDEIDVSVSPSEIDSCDVGTHTVTYKATGIDDGQFGVTTCIEPLLHAPNLCNYRTIQKSRTIEVLSVDPPVISGIGDESIEVGGSLDLLSGVSAIDANGNTVDVSYSGEINELASGEIASFETDLAKPLQSLTVTLDPIQDLNGYDSPWVGGAGVNKYDSSLWEFPISRFTWGSNSPSMVSLLNSLPQGTYTITAKIKIDAIMSGAGNQRIYGFLCNGNGVYIDARTTIDTPTVGDDITINKTFTLTASQVGNFTAIYWYAALGSATDDRTTIYDVGINTGAETNYTPYENICPISGHTEVDVEHTGVNIWDEEWELGYYNVTTGEPATSSQNLRSKNFIPVVPNTSYYVKTPTGYIAICEYDADKNFIRCTQGIVNSGITTTADTHFIRFHCTSAYGTTYNNDISINYPSTDHDYHAYEGDTYTANLPQTVYGGTLDLVSGVLTVDRAMVDLGTLTWGYSSADTRFYNNSVDYKRPASATEMANAICSQYVATKLGTLNDGMMCLYMNGYIYIKDSRYTNATDFKSAMNGVQLVYELATPQTYQLTPQQINSLLGDNNVWSEQGSVAVVYARSIQNRSETFDVEGLYEITYTAEDKCGNERTAVRTITVGDLSSTE